MWRPTSSHSRGETRFLNEALSDIFRDASLRERADLLIDKQGRDEPLFLEAMSTPQTPTYHAEGPFLRDHVRTILMVFFAVVDGRIHLTDIEEFRSLKGYEGEIEELEELVKEQAGFFQAFALCHDLGKAQTIVFQAPRGSALEKNGFVAEAGEARHPFSVAQRRTMLRRYQEHFDQFTKAHADLSQEGQYLAWFAKEQITIHFPGHSEAMFSPVLRSVISRIAGNLGVPEKGIQLLEDIIAQHLEPLKDFIQVRAVQIRKYFRFAQEYGFDGDDFLDMLQAAVFLDSVCGSIRYSHGKKWHDPSVLINFLRSEYEYDPARVGKKILAREQDEKLRRNKVFRDVGLDGAGLMTLLQMKPGPSFGKQLADIQGAVLGGGDLPSVSPSINTELSRRMERFYEKWFSKDL